MPTPPQWQIQPVPELPPGFMKSVQRYTGGLDGRFAAQLLWQRGMQDIEQLPGFLNPKQYQPASPFAFGEEMTWAIARLQQARDRAEKVAIWGDFDADGITATAVLWEGLQQFFLQDQLTYTIPNRLTDSHGLSMLGVAMLSSQGYTLIVTCDTGSTNPTEINYARQLGMDVIVTDHHTLPRDRPNVTAIINPRSLPADHPLSTLSGVAVAYKLIEALHLTLPDVPTKPLEALLDLVAIGLIADLVELKGDCRYLAQKGIEQLQKHMQGKSSRPGIAKLLELCRKNGDRPTDISFGIGPRINAISRIHGDARFCVELLTSQDVARCQELALDTELANTRRKALQKEVAQDVTARIAQLDLSTTDVIVLADPQWSVGVLGLVAGQIAREYSRPTILLTTDSPSTASAPHTSLARGSARSTNGIDLYQLLSAQAHLLQGYGGHPFAAGLSLPAENLSLFTEAINRQFRQQYGAEAIAPIFKADLTVTVAELGKDLFRELKLLEPYGMGNPAPILFIANCWFEKVWNANIKDLRGRKVSYIRTSFELWDDAASEGFPGVWWEHYKDEVPQGRCDVLAELDYNAYGKRYELRLVAVRPSQSVQVREVSWTPGVDWILDWRGQPDPQPEAEDRRILVMSRCPTAWADLTAWFRRALREEARLAIAYSPPSHEPPVNSWQTLVGIAKYLSRTGKAATRVQVLNKLGLGDRPLQLGIRALQQSGFSVTSSEAGLHMIYYPDASISEGDQRAAIEAFFVAIQEERFQQRYFYTVPIATIRAIARGMDRSPSADLQTNADHYNL